MDFRTNLKLASFDGGGIHGLSQLEIMNHIMHQLTWDDESKESDGHSLPCERFDLIGGSGTGGLIAILLAKLRMSVEEASEEFYDIIKYAFSPKNISASQRTEALRRCIENILEKKGFPVDLQLTMEKQEGCPSFVVASPRTDAKSTIRLRSYFVGRQPPSPITVVEAVLATCSTQPEFAPVPFGAGYGAWEYIAASGAMNPIYEVITEAHLLFGGYASVASLLSLGTAHPAIFPYLQEGGEVALRRVMRDMMHDCEQKAHEIEERIGGIGIYSRFSVDQGMQTSHVGQLDDPRWITAQTEDYLGRHEIGEKLDLLVHNFGVKTGPITLGQLQYSVGLSTPSLVAITDQKSLETPVSGLDDELITKLKPKGLERGTRIETCLEGTRLDILQEIRSWSEDLDAPNILWISGYPGVGKSAIASTIVGELHSSNRLGSSFFFQWERASAMTPNVLWRIVAYDLAQRYPGIHGQLVTALAAHPDLLTISNIDAVFRELIYEPLMKSDNIPTEKLPVIVLDALNECGGIDGWRSDHRSKLMRTLKRWSELPARFKLIVTSRRESDIEQLFSNTVHYPIEIAAGEAVNFLSCSDIRTFLMHEFRQLQARYSSLPYDWPGDEVISWLIDQAGGLFIWIKTIIKLLWRGEPQRTLRQVLSNRTGGMADLYTRILRTSFRNRNESDFKDFRAVLGAIIFIKEPLDNASLANFLSMDGSTLESIFTGLQPVLDCDGITRIHHQSFIDFLLNPEECPPSFLIDGKHETRNLALCCLNTMRKHLRFNICDLESSYVKNQDVPNLAQRIDECIPPYLSYSSRYWASHLVEIEPDKDINNGLQHFMRHQFLSWLETMSLIKQINTGSSMLWSLVKWLRNSYQDDSLARDMQKFLAAFASVISQSVPHIYISALPFAPRGSQVSNRYLRRYPQTIVVKGGGCNSWPAIQMICTGHKGTIISAAFLPDGRRVVSGSQDCTIRVWDVETGETVLGPLQGHNGLVASVSLSPDGRRIVSGSYDHTIRIWDAETGEMVLGPLEGHNDSVWSVAFSPDGMRIVSGSEDRTIRVWDAGMGEMILGPLKGHRHWVRSVSFSPDGARIVSGSEDQTIRIWDASTGKTILRPLEGHEGPICSVSFSPDGRRIVSGSEDQTIRVWDAESGQTILGPLRGHGDGVRSVSLSPDGRRIVSGSGDQTIRVWDAETGEIVLGPLQGHKDPVCTVSFSPDGRTIVSGSEDHTIRVWDDEMNGNTLAPLQGHSSWVRAVSFSPDGRRIVSGSEDHTIRIWDVETGEMVMGPLEGHDEPISSVSFSPDGRRIFSGSEDRTIRIWDAKTGQMTLGPLKGHHDWIRSISLSPDGRRIVSGSEDRTIRVWDTTTGKTILGPLKSSSGPVFSVSFSPEGRRIVSGYEDHTIRVWDTKTGKMILGPLNGHSELVESVSFSPDGTQIVSGSEDHTIRIWDARDGKMVLGPLEGHDKPVSSVSFSPDGRHIVSGSEDDSIRIWDAKTGETLLGPLDGHSGSVSSVSFSPDGRRIVSGSEDHTIRVWNAEIDGNLFASGPDGRERHSWSPKSNDYLADIYTLFRKTAETEDGWIRGPHSELLFWVLPEVRSRLCSLSNILVIDERHAWTTLDLGHFVHGEEWTRCKDRRVT